MSSSPQQPSEPDPAPDSRAARGPVASLARLLDEARLARVARWSLRIVAFGASLSIAVAESALGVATIAWIASALLHGRPRWPRTSADRPLAALLACGVIAGIAGIDAKTALWSLHSYAILVLFYLVLAFANDAEERRRLVAALTAGLFIAAWHRLYNHLWNNFHPHWGPGRMTRAGQLVLGIALLHALWLETRTWKGRTGLGVVLAMLVAGLVGTLKRAAAVGTIAAVSVQLWYRNRKLVVIPLALGTVLAVGYGPARERLLVSWADFVNEDNRLHMWEIGGHLIRDYPLGIGTRNGVIMQRPDLWGPNPPKHRHFHSNLITICVEDGVLGLAAFLWWLGELTRMLVRRARETRSEGGFEAAVAMGAATGFMAWNLNGILEFNFGDAEVMLVFLLVLGIAFGPLVGTREVVSAGDVSASPT